MDSREQSYPVMIRPVSSTRVSTETHAARSTSTKEKKLTRPPSRRSFAKRSPSTVLASRNLRRERSPKGSAPEQVRHRLGGTKNTCAAGSTIYTTPQQRDAHPR